MIKEGFNSVCIIGVGLIGGSLALALKQNGIANRIIGYGRNEKRLIDALNLNVIDDFTLSLKEAANSEFIVLATPLGIFEKITTEISSFLQPNSILMDVGSVKKHVINTIENIIPENVHFIPTHPIAGSEKTGFEHARQDLFKGARVIITPTEKTDQKVLERISRMWQIIGALVEFMSAEEHDKIYALMSHLPHLISFCLVNTVYSIDANLIKYAGSGFKDTTRIAKSSPEIWKDIFLMNKDNIFKTLDFFIYKIEEIKKLISQGNSEDKIIEFIETAKKLRKTID